MLLTSSNNIVVPGDCTSRGREILSKLDTNGEILSGGTVSPKHKAGNWALSWRVQKPSDDIFPVVSTSAMPDLF